MFRLNAGKLLVSLFEKLFFLYNRAIVARRAVVFFCLSLSLPSCATFVGQPTYSQHSSEQIFLEQKVVKKGATVFIKHTMGDIYGIEEHAIKNVAQEMEKNGLRIVEDFKLADYIVSINIRSIANDIDANFAKNSRNSLIRTDMNADFNFDSSNTPHIFTAKLENIKEQSNMLTLRRRAVLPSVLYTLLGGSAGFIAGYFIAGTFSPVGMGFVGAFALGGITYTVYSIFKDIGIMIIYDIVIEERKNRQITHNRKALIRPSGNIADEVFYSYDNRYDTYMSKNVVIATGSKVLRKKMMLKLTDMISNSVLNVFNIGKKNDVVFS